MWNMVILYPTSKLTIEDLTYVVSEYNFQWDCLLIFWNLTVDKKEKRKIILSKQWAIMAHVSVKRRVIYPF